MNHLNSSELATFLDICSVAMIALNKHGKIFFANREAQNLLGLYKRDNKFYLEPNWEIGDYNGKVLAKDKSPFNIVMKTKKSFKDMRISLKLENEEILFLSINANPILNAENEIETILFSMEDITKKKLVEEKLFFQEKFLSTVLDTPENFIITTNGRYLYSANRAFFKFFKYKNLKEFHKEHDCVCDFFEKVDRKEYLYADMGGMTWLEYMLKNPNQTHKALIKKDKNYIFTLNAKHMHFDEKERSVVVFTNISEIEEYRNNLEDIVSVEMEKRRKQEQLIMQQAKMVSMGEMLSAIAHQWRQPLNIISLAIQNLTIKYQMDGEIDLNDIEELNENAMQHIDFMSKTIDDFRSFFKKSNEKQYFDIKKAMATTTSLIKPELEVEQIDCKCKINDKSKDEFLIYGHPNEFKNAILNIIDNSKDAIKEKMEKENFSNGKISVKLNIFSDKATIEVSDNGVGIENDILDKIYEPYFTTKFQSMGTGLGLYMAKTVIEKNMGGKISVKKLKDGIKFTIEIKRAKYKKNE